MAWKATNALSTIRQMLEQTDTNARLLPTNTLYNNGTYIYIYEPIYITYKICMRSFITTRVWHREREGEKIRYWQKWNVIVAIHWEIKFLRIQSSCVCERECVVRIETLSRAGGTKKSVCVKIWRAIIMRLLYCHNLRSVCTHLSVSAMKSASWGTIFYVCADTKWEAQKWIP